MKCSTMRCVVVLVSTGMWRKGYSTYDLAMGGIPAILSGIGLILEMELVEDIAQFSAGHGLGLDSIVMGIIAILVGIVVLVLELDRIVVEQHLVRGILYIILALFAPGGGLVLLIAGIVYIIAEFV